MSKRNGPIDLREISGTEVPPKKNTVEPKAARGFKSFAARFAWAAFIFLFLVLYLWVIQLKHDGIDEPGLAKAILYALIVLGAGFSYDLAKSVFFMPDDRFRAIFVPARSMLGYVVVSFSLCVLTAAFAHYKSPLAAVVSYAAALAALIPFFLSSEVIWANLSSLRSGSE